MPKAIVFDHKPLSFALYPGTYYWCACGRSKNQPFCDGSHQGSGIYPQEFVVEEESEAYLCLCKQSKDSPYCDGSHARIAKDVTELPALAAHVDSEVKKQASVPMASQSSSDNAMPEAVNTPEEPIVEYIHNLAKHGLSLQPEGPLDAMGVPRSQLPDWNQIQLVTAQMAKKPLPIDAPVATELVIGPNAKKPLVLKTPLFVSDMSFGALSAEAKLALAKGAELAGTGICSGEGGMLPAEKAANSRYLFELGTGEFGYRDELMRDIQAFHFKGGQAAKTGIGGHLPGSKVTAEIAAVRHLPEGKDAISPSTFAKLSTTADFREFAERIRELSGGVPIGFKLSAQHIENDIDFALESSADYIILDGRGGGTGAAPLIFRDHISVPSIPALARARRHLDRSGREGVTLIITGGLRTPADFIKALCLGADGVALANSAIQAICCVGARICHTNNCPACITTQQPRLRARLDVAAERLANFFNASTGLMQIMARACGHSSLADFCLDDLTTWDEQMARLSGVPYSGVMPL